ncbi:MAG: glycerate kinase, partial [Desulfopila sp.]
MNKRLSEMRQDAVSIFQAGLEAARPDTVIKRCCKLDGDILKVNDHTYDLNAFARVLVLGTGKGGASMARAMEDILGERISAGIITVKYGHLEHLKTVGIVEAGHPVPDHNGLKGAHLIYNMALAADQETLIICIISGGGSALMPFPVEGVSLADKQETTRVLLGCGATIHEINTIRKHLSVIKGGGLAKAVYPATLVTLILSDVIGDDLDSIASGPCVPDSTTFADCRAILDTYDIAGHIPPGVMHHIEAGAAGKMSETPKKGDAVFEKSNTIIIARNFDALLSAKLKSDELGYNTTLLSSMIEGETKGVAAVHMAIARETALHDFPAPKPACILSGGETTVTIKGEGKGGRNQEFVLAALLKMGDMDTTVVLSAGTDGTDGPTDAAG